MESKNELSCDVVRDLLPMYCEQLVSQDSKEAVEKHFEHCAACKKIYEEMGEEFEIKEEEKKKDIAPFKKVKRRNIIKILAASLICVGLCIAAFFFLFVGVVPVNSTDVDVTYTAEKYEEDGKTMYSVDFELKLPKGENLQVRSEAVYDEKLHNYIHVQHPYRICKLPFDDLRENPNEFNSGVLSDEPFDETSTYVIKYRDKTVTYNLKEIAEECGIQ